MVLKKIVFFFCLIISTTKTIYAQDLNSLLQIYTYRSNYLLPYTKTNIESSDRKKSEAKFQFSLRKPMLGQNGNFALNLAYTQKSFWQLYNASNSRKVRENNYNPEVFLRTAGKNVYFDFGYEHESNGEDEPESRGWDNAFITFNIDTTVFSSYLKAWTIIVEEQGKGAEGKEQPIQNFYGHGELEMTFKGDVFHLSLFGRHNFKTKKGLIKSDLTFPLGSFSAYFHMQYLRGYGESLIDYNKFTERFGVGIMLSR